MAAAVSVSSADAAARSALSASSKALSQGHAAQALEEALTAQKHLRTVQQLGGSQQPVSSLALATLTSMATAMVANKRYKEALQVYQEVLKQHPQAAQYRANIGNILLRQANYSGAVRELRMALDQLPPTARHLRAKVSCNLGIALLHQHQYQDALTAFEGALEQALDPLAAFNTAVCASALEDCELAKLCFSRLVQACSRASNSGAASIPQAGEADAVLQQSRATSHRYLVTAAQLLAPLVEADGDAAAGYDWCCQTIKSAGFMEAMNALSNAQSAALVHFGAHKAAVQALKVRNAQGDADHAGLPLALLRQDRQGPSAPSVTTDRTNVAHIINEGCWFAARCELAGAKQAFEDALQLNPSCHQALYNLGLAQRQEGNFKAAQATFERLHRLAPASQETMYQVARVLEAQGQLQRAVDWLVRVAMAVPQDAGLLALLGSLHARLGADHDALRCYQEAHDVMHNNREALKWLAAYSLKQQDYRQAEEHYRQLERLDGAEARWPAMVAACLRSQGLTGQALVQYRRAHAAHPSNLDCLRQLTALCKEQGLGSDFQSYSAKLEKAEKAAQQEQPLQVLQKEATSPARSASMKVPSVSRPATASALSQKGLQLPGFRALLGKGPSTASPSKPKPKDQWSEADEAIDLLP